MSAPVPIDFSNAWKSGAGIVNKAISLLPNLLIALVIFVAFVILASTAKSMARRLSSRHQHRGNLTLLLGQLAQTLVLILGFLVAFSVLAPSFRAANLIQVLGIGSVAIGFAFQNILQNFLAGILLLMQEPFTIGDWISVTGIEGKVDDIQTRATIVLTEEGKRVVIPNAILFTNPVAVGQSKRNVESEQEPGAQLATNTQPRRVA
jgi:small conductance mechanosensitive channel